HYEDPRTAGGRRRGSNRDVLEELDLLRDIVLANFEVVRTQVRQGYAGRGRIDVDADEVRILLRLRGRSGALPRTGWRGLRADEQPGGGEGRDRRDREPARMSRRSHATVTAELRPAPARRSAAGTPRSARSRARRSPQGRSERRPAPRSETSTPADQEKPRS